MTMLAALTLLPAALSRYGEEASFVRLRERLEELRRPGD